VWHQACLTYMGTNVSYEYMASLFMSENLCDNAVSNFDWIFYHWRWRQNIPPQSTYLPTDREHHNPKNIGRDWKFRMGKSYRKCDCERGTISVLSVILIQHVPSHQTFTQEALPTGIGPTGNTIPDTVDCVNSLQPHNNISK